jgi:nicotinamide-nucleotide amidase
MEFIAIGDELLSGRITDANGPKLAEVGQRLGYPLTHLQIIGDEMSEIKKTLKEAATRSELIICSGGLGPTPDDRTKHALAELLEVPLEDSPKAREIVKVHYQRIHKNWGPEINSYHLIPQGVDPLENPNGLAPGLLAKLNKAQIVFLPGPPREFHAMLGYHLERITQTLQKKPQRLSQFCVRTYGVPEEKIFGELCPTLWEELEKYGKLSSLPNFFGVDLVLQASKTMSEIEQENWAEQIKQHLFQTAVAPNIWQFGEQDLASYLLDQMRSRSLTLGLAESCTGGLASSFITDVPGCSDIFYGSIVSYHNNTKINILNVDPHTIQEYGAVSENCVRQMADGARKVLGVDAVISYSGIAGPTGGSEAKPVGTLAIALSTSWAPTQSQICQTNGDRKMLKSRFAVKGLHWLLTQLPK